MATYIMLAKWTEQGIRTVKETVNRSHEVSAEFERRGIRVKGLYWPQAGDIDVLLIAESADDRVVAAATLAIKSLGNVRVETVRAFDAAEMQAIVDQL